MRTTRWMAVALTLTTAPAWSGECPIPGTRFDGKECVCTTPKPDAPIVYPMGEGPSAEEWARECHPA